MSIYKIIVTQVPFCPVVKQYVYFDIRVAYFKILAELPGLMAIKMAFANNKL